MEISQVTILLAIGFFGGVWNAIAGGATLFTFPALMAIGLPPVVANATNYLALLPSNAAALPAYYEELRGVGRALVPLLLISSLGGVIGALLLLVSDPSLFETLIPILILIATLLFAYGDSLRLRLLKRANESHTKILTSAVLFISSVYGGYFGAGLGIILLAIAQIMGFSNFHVANGIKNLLATSFTIVSILIFGIGGLIAWPAALTMMVGSTVGGYLGGRCSKFVNQTLLRRFVIAFGFVLSLVYFMKTYG